ncbi:MAG: hypothetical protein LQ343_005353 [Gyalolechia ehrenbergii]|nr:MAG: hypothetical protein LQ343_005353 [Gyalolechia ehrenbergii]
MQGEPAFSTVHENDSHQGRCQLLYPILRNSIQRRQIRSLIDEVYIPMLECAATSQLVFDAKAINDAMMFDIVTELASGGQGRTTSLRETMIIGKSVRYQRDESPHASWQQTFVDLVSNFPGLGHALSSTRISGAQQLDDFYGYDREIQHQTPTRDSEVYNSRVAGYAAVGQTLTLAMQNLSQHRDLQKCLYEHFRDNHALASRMPARRQQPDLCQSVIIETLRLRGRGPLPCVGPAHRGPLGKFHLPAHTQVSIPLYVSHSNPRVIANSVQWDPMRWVDTSVDVTGPAEEIGTKNEGYIACWSSFGAYAGDDLAIYTMRYVLGAVYSRFVSETVDGGIRVHHVGNGKPM